MNRLKFSFIESHHPLLLFVRNHLIHQGFELVDMFKDDFDFLLAGQEWGPHISGPVILLSTDDVYSDRDLKLQVKDQDYMSEEDPSVIPSPLDTQAWKPLRSLESEHNACMLNSPAMILRIFGVYGPTLPYTGIIPRLVEQSKRGESHRLFSPGYQVRTYLYEDDFLRLFDLLLERFLNGTTGIYNVGSEETISINKLSKSISQFCGVNQKVEYIKRPSLYRWWVVPDMIRTKSITGFTENRSLRSGLWDLCDRRY